MPMRWIGLLSTSLLLSITGCTDLKNNPDAVVESWSSSSSLPYSSPQSEWCNTQGNCGAFKDSRELPPREYLWTKISEQKWMAENLDYDTADGVGSWCFDDEKDNCELYGRLYLWSTAMAGGEPNHGIVRGICPEGWHIPSDSEWTELIYYLDYGHYRNSENGSGEGAGISTGVSLISPGAAAKLKSPGLWVEHEDAENLDTYGFTALPAGIREGKGYQNATSEFQTLGSTGYWLTSTTTSGNNGFQYALFRRMDWDADTVGGGSIDLLVETDAVSVRCVEDPVPESSSSSSEEPSSSSEASSSSLEESSSSSSPYVVFEDLRDHHNYNTIVIGSQTWMAENLDYDTSGAACYNDDAENCNTYGRLYDWSTALTVCPEGWRLPDSTDWEDLFATVGGAAGAGTQLRSTSVWNSDGGGSDGFLFTALPGGFYDGQNMGVFGLQGDFGGWWSSSNAGSGAYALYLNGGSPEAFLQVIYLADKFSVRCLAIQ